MTSVGAIILNHKRWPDTLKVVRSLQAQTHLPESITIVDNNSGSLEVQAIKSDQRGFELISLADNRGYAAGMNAGISQLLARGVDAVLLLTHDARLEKDCLNLLVAEIDHHPTTGVASPVLGWDGRPEVTWSAGGAITTLSGTPHHPQMHSSLASQLAAPTRSVAWCDGAVLLVRTNVFAEVGLLSEEYFLYFEEVDFQTRVRRAGRDVRVVSGALAWQSPGQTPAYLAVRNQLIFLRAHKRRSVPFFLVVVLYRCTREFGKVVLRPGSNSRRIWAMGHGIRDGFNGRLRQDLFSLG